jgi:hypothetical protein
VHNQALVWPLPVRHGVREMIHVKNKEPGAIAENKSEAFDIRAYF